MPTSSAIRNIFLLAPPPALITLMGWARSQKTPMKIPFSKRMTKAPPIHPQSGCLAFFKGDAAGLDIVKRTTSSLARGEATRPLHGFARLNDLHAVLEFVRNGLSE